MVLIEAMANGTPVIAYDRGSVPEIITQGKTGFIVHNIKQAVHAVENLHRISRTTCRKTFENSFTARIMAEKYVSNYKKLITPKTLVRRLQTARI